jgi:NADPH-dependent FMN reductase
MSAPQPMHPERPPDDPVEQSPIRVLLVSGSVRDRSTNTAVLRTVQALAPPNVEAVVFDGILHLPHFNPDDDTEGAQVPDAVARMREAVRSADALLICTPEYAGAMPAVLKNLLEWTIGGREHLPQARCPDQRVQPGRSDRRRRRPRVPRESPSLRGHRHRRQRLHPSPADPRARRPVRARRGRSGTTRHGERARHAGRSR